MSITEFARAYWRRVGGSPGYLEQLLVLTKRLPWQASDLTPDNIDNYLDSALEHLSPSTVANHRRMLRTLMRFAAEQGHVDKDIVRPLRRVKTPAPCPIALDHRQIAHWVSTAKDMPGGTLTCPYRLLLPAWILTAYSTGLRTGDLLAIRYDQIRGHRLLLSQLKTSEPHVAWLDDSAILAIESLPRRGPKVFGSLTNKDRILHAMRRLVKQAGQGGTTRWLRRAGATYCEAAGKDATRHLGHRDPGMKKRYIDRLLLAELTEHGPTAPPIPAAILSSPSQESPAGLPPHASSRVPASPLRTE
jgi:integrase